MKKCIELKGGKCEKCNYNKCSRALCFHHTNPKEKSFEITSRTILSNSWESIEKELEKCNLLCHNCHMELHNSEQTTKYAKLIKEMYNYDV